jgi:pRiA4b ORF-3-like protein
MKEILVFHVRLAEIAPAIWRRLEIRAEGTFWHLHCAIQDAMPWEDRHLHEFRFPTGDEEARIGLPGYDEFEEDEGLVASWETLLKDWFVAVPSQCLYVYDFGDDWVHTVTLESRRAAESGVRYPRCTAGARRCPPEDVGGAHGYSEFLEALSNRHHSEHQAYLQWVGGRWNPEDFRPEGIVFSRPAIRLRQAGLA